MNALEQAKTRFGAAMGRLEKAASAIEGGSLHGVGPGQGVSTNAEDSGLATELSQLRSEHEALQSITAQVSQRIEVLVSEVESVIEE
ncbi:MAG: hypothetical protein V7761_07975 [Amylibacter sp.]